MNSEVVVFSLSAKKIPSVKKFTNLVAEDCDLGGSIVIIKLSDVDFLFQYESDCRSNVLVSVLDNIVLQKDSNRFRVLDGDNPAIFSIDEYSDYLLFEEAVLECRMLSEMVLRLGAVVRDLYYAGIYSSAAADVDDFNLCDEILSLGRKEDNSTELKLFDLTFDEHDMTRKNIKDDIEGDQKQASSGSIGAKDLITNIDCVFCGAQKTMDTAKKFAIHPYVPITFEKKPVYMCLLCLDNWKEYREKAVLDDQLVLEGESNEELCGICSDTPHELTMCCKCPRSFCMTCLSRVLTSQQKDDLDNPADWICMCCTAKISSEPPPLSSSQWRIVTPIFKSKGIEDTSGVGKNQITDKCSTLSLDYPSPLSMPGMLLKDNTNRIKTEQILGSECTVQISLNRTFQGEKVKKMINEDKAGTLVSLSRIKCSAEVKSNNGKANITASKSSKNKLCLKLSASAVTSVKRSAGDFVNANAGKINRSESLNLAVKPPSGVLPVRDHKAKKMDQCAVPEVLVRACAPGVQSEDKLIESEGHPPVRVNVLTNVTHSEPVLLPLSSTVDEVFYFSQYIEGSSFVDRPCGGKKSATDDVCFLCKDGGELIECDHIHRGSKGRKRCQRVYHTYCLSFAVNESSKHWTCPRHFCDTCGTKNLKFVCQYCPMSTCESCAIKNHEKTKVLCKIVPSTSRETSFFNENVCTIICTNCARMLERCRLQSRDSGSTIPCSISPTPPSPTLHAPLVSCSVSSSSPNNFGKKIGNFSSSREMSDSTRIRSGRILLSNKIEAKTTKMIRKEVTKGKINITEITKGKTNIAVTPQKILPSGSIASRKESYKRKRIDYSCVD